jgi:hypothetical protein
LQQVRRIAARPGFLRQWIKHGRQDGIFEAFS